MSLSATDDADNSNSQAFRDESSSVHSFEVNDEGGCKEEQQQHLVAYALVDALAMAAAMCNI